MNTNQHPPLRSRRSVLGHGLLGAAALAAARPARLLGAAAPAAAVPVKAPAKAVIQIWMWGGPCHLDTFDPKPEAGRDYCGPLDKPIATNVDGIRICELLPQLARIADKYAIIRSMTHGVNAHETASYITQTGHKPDRLVYPTLGAIVSLFKGYDHGYRGLIPPYVVLSETQGRFSESGFLGQKYKPFATGGDPNQARFAVEGVVSQGITDEHQAERRELLHKLDTLGQALPGSSEFKKLEATEKSAYELILGDARKLFDLNQEKTEMRDKYGRHTFGQSCLMARRLVEAGVPFVTINYKGWDTHKQHFETMRRRLPEMDQGMAALLTDLYDRGMLDSTIVWWGGEFGRTPKVQWEAPWNGGRGHFGNCFGAVVAGGGFKGGRVVGASDARGENVAARPVRSQDLLGSMCGQLGIDPDGPLPNPLGLDLKVMPSTSPGGRLKELLA